MADAEKEKAEKVAAARKKYEQMKKQKEKGKKGDKKKKTDDSKASKDESKDKDAPAEDKDKNEEAEAEDEDDTAANDDAPEPESSKGKEKAEDISEDKASDARPPHARKQSVSVQSKLRSESFRRGSASGDTSLSPGPGEEVAEIYSKQKTRLDELERENKKLSKDLDAAETRTRKLEDELEPLREGTVQLAELKMRAEKAEEQAGQLEKVKAELTGEKREVARLQSLSAKGRGRGESNASPAATRGGKDGDLQAQLDSKVATIESMSVELSALQAQVSKSTAGASEAHTEQVKALEEKVKRAEKAEKAAQSELKDLRAKVDKLSAAAVKDGSEKSSSSTRITGLEHDLGVAQKRADEATKKAENLEAKLETLTKLQREGEPRRREAEKERETAVKEASSLKQKVVGLEEENRRLKIKERSKGEVDDDGIDELEDEERKRLELRVRELEGEVFELRRGVWRDKRIELQGGMDEGGLPDRSASNTGFDEVDLSGGAPRQHAARPSVSKGRSGFANVIQSGFNAFTGNAPAVQEDGLLDDDMDDFDEDAFRKAHEEDGLKRIERIKDIKRGLKEWAGWRLDLVDQRMGGGGAGEIFEV